MLLNILFAVQYLFTFKCCKYTVLALVVLGNRIKKIVFVNYLLEHYQFLNKYLYCKFNRLATWIHLEVCKFRIRF